MKILKLGIFLLFGSIMTTYAQVRISDTNNNAPAANAILELHSGSGNKGIVPPTAALTSFTDATTIASPSAGMLVYRPSGSAVVPEGYYTWDGAKWKPFATGLGGVNVITHISDTTLTKDETFVVASGEITLTLPAVTSADNGLAITIKHTGTASQQINVIAESGKNIDNSDTSKLYRHRAHTYIAYNTNWLIKEKIVEMANTYDVGPNESWTTIPEILAFLAIRRHMLLPSVIRLEGGTYSITATETINLDNALTIQGPSYGQAYVVDDGITSGNAIFDCVSEVSFKMIAFQGTGNVPNGLQLPTTLQYHEIKDCTFDGFDKAILITNNVDVWLFESDISNCTTGVDVDIAGGNDYISFFTSESAFTDCTTGINLKTGDSATISIQNCTFDCSASQTGLDYSGSTTFIGIKSLFFTNNTWNNIGTFVNGFDYTLARDANVDIINNAGIESNNPKCLVSVSDEATTTTTTSSSTWYTPSWTVDESAKVKFTVSGNLITYLPNNPSNLFMIVSGNMETNIVSSITVAVAKTHGATTTYHGATTFRQANQTTGLPLPFTTVVYLPGIAKNDEFRIRFQSSANATIRFQDINLFVNSQ